MRHFWQVRFLLSNWAYALLNQKLPSRFRHSPQKSEFPRFCDRSKWAIIRVPRD
jgi:hypothetical protein